MTARQQPGPQPGDNTLIDPLRAIYEDAGRPYGSSQAGFDRWCDEQDWPTLAGERLDDPRRTIPVRNRRIRPQ